ncbi:MAG: hypothetical protein Q9221_007984 [Calogaya cf. arnoldii]
MNGLPNGSSNAPGSPGYNTPYARSRSSTLGNNISNGTLHQTPSPCKASLFHSTSNEEATPFFCFHDGSGQGNVYARIADIDRTLYAFSDPDFASNHPRPRSLIEMAGRYAATISRAETPNVILGGWSFGGVVAFEATQILQRLGFNVRGLVLIDSPYPQNHEPLPEDIIRFILGRSAFKNGFNKDTGKSSHLLTEF